MKLIWGRSDWPNSRTVDTHIGRIRQKLCLESRPGLRLQPVYGVGYRLDVFP
jgi:DNA-binding response OmpR family regulator